MLLLAQAALLVLGAVWVLVADLGEGRQQVGQTVGEAVLIVVLAGCAAALGVAVARGWALAKTPVLLWGGLVTLCGLTLATSGAPPLGVAVAVIGVATVVAGARLVRYDAEAGS